MNINFFLVCLGDKSTIFNGESCVKEVNKSKGNDIRDIPLQHSKIVDVVRDGLTFSC